MAQPYRPELHNIDAVLRYYENSEAAAFSVYAGHKIDETVRRYSYDGEDKIKGGQELSEALQSVASNPNNTNTYLLVINKRVKNKLVPENTITFQLNDSRIMPYQAMAGPGNNSGEIAALRAELAALRMQLAAQAEDPDDDEDEDEDEDGEDDDNSNDDDDDDDDFFKSGQGSPSLDHRSTAAMTLGKSLWVNGAITAIEGGIAAAMPWDSALPRRFPPTK